MADRENSLGTILKAVNLPKAAFYFREAGPIDDLLKAKEFREQIEDILSKSDSNNLILDLSKVGFMNKKAWGVVVDCAKEIHKKGGSFIILDMNPGLEVDFEMTGLSEYEEIKTFDLNK